jgi:hypothetical protein
MTRRALSGEVGTSTLVALATALAMVGASSCIDASHDDQVQALGGEAPGVQKGPNHRPGQPCLVCHGGLGPASARFVMAGTVYAVQGETNPSSGARVHIEDANGAFYTAITNRVGNFYITPAQWAPPLPATVQVTQGQNSQQMQTNIGRDGSCAACHTQSPGPTSPGPVYVVAGALPEAGP